jgi:nucleoid-associated protein YgaU
VAPGESLWTIARSNLAGGTGRGESEVRTREVAAYWLRLLAANRARLRSGNPDLIYPGEYVRLPAIKRSTGS